MDEIIEIVRKRIINQGIIAKYIIDNNIPWHLPEIENLSNLYFILVISDDLEEAIFLFSSHVEYYKNNKNNYNTYPDLRKDHNKNLLQWLNSFLQEEE